MSGVGQFDGGPRSVIGGRLVGDAGWIAALTHNRGSTVAYALRDIGPLR